MSTTKDNNNIIVGPDYGQMIKASTNGAIIEAFLAFLFSNKTKFTWKTLTVMARNISIIFFIKLILEDSKSYFDTFRLTNVKSIQYFYQRIKFSEKRYVIINYENKWKYEDKIISINTLSPELIKKSIYVTQPGTYYYNVLRYVIKVIVTADNITFCSPNTQDIIIHMENMLQSHEEVIHGGKTTVYRLNITGSAIKFEPIQIVTAIPTSIYLELEDSLKTYYQIDDAMNINPAPNCFSFDGEPGTGKTTFGSYISSSGIFDRVIICNLIHFTHTNFSDLITTIERQLTTTSKSKNFNEKEKILIIFEEMDKWLKSYTGIKINELREEARKVNESTSKEKETVVKCAKLTGEEEIDKIKFIKEEFMDHLFKLVEGHILQPNRKYALIFNTNNFDDLFSNLDKRYDALISRFTRFNFKKINNKEIAIYLKEFYKRVSSIKSGNNGEISNIKQPSDEIYKNIPDDYQTTYRDLYNNLKFYKYDVQKFISNLNVCKK